MNSQIILADVKLTYSEKQVRDGVRRSEERCIVWTLIKYKLQMSKKKKKKGIISKIRSPFLSHLLFSFIVNDIIIFYVMITIIVSIFCFHFYNFVECPNITFKGSWYMISVEGGSWHWSSKRFACQSQEGDLVSIETEEEWNFINNEIQRLNTTNYENIWDIGLTKKAGNWTWVNGRPLTIYKWGQGEPSGEHDIAAIYKWSSNGERGVFGNFGEGRTKGDNYAYICEISKGKLFFCFVLFCFFNKLF